MEIRFEPFFCFLRAGAVLSFWLACAGICRADLVLSNTNQSTGGTSDINNDSWVAQSFVTSAPDLNLSSVTLDLADTAGGPGAPLNVSIYSDASGMPGADLLDLTAATSEPATAGFYLYTAPGGLPLADNTDYWIVASTGAFGDSGSFEWNFTNTNDVDNPGTPTSVDATSGWAIDTDNTYSTSGDAGATWETNGGAPQQFSVQASVPEPGTWAMVGMGGAMLLGLGRRGLRKSG